MAWRAVLLLLLLPDSVVGAAVRGSSRVSLARVQDTLQSLLINIQDTGRKAEKLFGERRQWCDDTLHSLDERTNASKFSTAHLRADMAEQEAASEEAQSVARQIQAQIAMVQHTVAVTKAHLQDSAASRESSTLSGVLKTRQQTLNSLQVELDTLLPSLSQLQVETLETKRQIDDQVSAALPMTAFVVTIRDGCVSSQKMAEVQASARMQEATSVERALRGLEKVLADLSSSAATVTDSVVESPEIDDTEEDEELMDTAPPVALLQLVQEQKPDADKDLSSIITDDPSIGNERRARPSGKRFNERSATSRASSSKSAALMSKIKAQKGAVNATRSAWCSQERARNNQLLESLQASARSAGDQIRAHANAEAELTERIDKLHEHFAAVEGVAKEAANITARELEFLQIGSRDQSLAGKILKQAYKIVKSVEATTSLTKVRADLDGVVRELSKSSSAFQAAAMATGKTRKVVQAVAKATAAGAKVASQEMAKQRQSLHLARDGHTSQRILSEKEKLEHETEAKQATEFLDKLAEGCDPVASSGEKRRRDMEMHALEDASRVLEGKSLVSHASQVKNLRGAEKRKRQKDINKLSPIERAAAEMGLSTDDN